MKTFVFLISSVLASASLSAQPSIRLSKDCRGGVADVNGGDIQFLNLNLDITAKDRIQKQECEILVKFPARSSQRLVVSQFQVEAFAELESKGMAFLSLRHNFNNEWENASRDLTIRPGARGLTVRDRAFKRLACDQPAFLQTNIVSSAKNAVLFQDNAQQIIKLQYRYESCR